VTRGEAVNRLWIIVLALVVGCADTGQSYVEIPIHASGIEDAPIDLGDGWTLDLERAEIGFGPIWLCASERASPEFCPTAVLELRETVAIDGLDPSPQMLGTMRGVTGSVRSAMFDYGISWIPTAQVPSANPGAPEGHSAVFAGRATHDDGRTFSFTCAIDLSPVMQGALVVGGRRIAEHAITSSDDALIVRVDPAAWWRRVDPERLASRGEDAIVIAPGDPDHEALVVAMTGGLLPSLQWATE